MCPLSGQTIGRAFVWQCPECKKRYSVLLYLYLHLIGDDHNWTMRQTDEWFRVTFKMRSLSQ